MDIPKNSAESVKQSYFNILALFMHDEKMETRFVKCLIRWGLQLNLTIVDINAHGKRFEDLKFTVPSLKIPRLEAIYHLVQMIYLDDVVEDVELEVASIYAEKLGFNRGIVGDLFKSIATMEADGAKGEDIRKEVIDFLKMSQQ